MQRSKGTRAGCVLGEKNAMSETRTDQLFEDIVETIREPLLLLDSDLKIISANGAFYEFFMVKPEETVGQLIYDLGNKQWNIPQLRELLETILPQKTTFNNYEVEHDFATIGKRTMLLNARQLKRALRKKQCILLVIEDITERKQLENVLNESEEKYRRAFETADDGIIFLEKSKLKIHQVNPAIMTMLGYSRKEFIGNELVGIGFPDEFGAVAEILQTLEQYGICHYRDVTVQSKAGQAIPTDIYMTDRTRLVQCNVRDVTERKMTEEKLQDLESKYRALFEGSADGILIADIDSKVFKYANPALCRMLGYTDEELRTMGVADIHPKDFLQSIMDKFEAQARGVKTLASDIPCLRKDGTIFHADINSFSIFLEGRMCNAGFFRDITERKRKENQEQLAHDVLKSLNRTNDAENTLADILRLIKDRLDFEAVGIRLQEGDDYPYFETTGLPEDFLRVERYLCERTETGEIVRDAEGASVLECMCGNVLRGRTNPALPFFTVNGSFWTNCTTQLLATTTEADRQARTRNRCNGEGYESVALIPLRSGGKIVGLLQFNDHRPNRFTPGMILFLEGLGESIGIALARKRAEEAERASLQILEGILKAIPVRVFWKDKNLVYVGCNAAFARDAGLTAPQDIIGKDDYQMVWRDQADLYRADDRQVIESGVAKLLIEEPQTTPNGDIITLLTNKVPLRDSNEDVTGLLGTYMDITERKKAEESFRENREKLHSILDNIGSGVTMISPAMEILELNRQMRKWFPGIDPRTRPLCYRALNNPPRDEICDYCPTCRTLQDGKIHTATIVTPTAGGSRNYHIVSSPILDKEGKVTAAIEMVEDVTSNLSLETQLRQSQKMEAIGTLAGGIAHDFNNILSSVIGYTELAQMKIEADSEIHDDLNEVLIAGARAKNLVKQILAFSRQTQQEQILIQTGLIVKEALKMIMATLPTTIDIHQNIQSKSIVLCDPTQIHQIIMNLCTNAAYAMREKGGILNIALSDVVLDPEFCSLHLGIQPGAYQQLMVGDTGHGMTADVMDRIFDPFFTTKAKDEGTGLGLSVVHGIVKELGGMVTVYSEPDKGTSFTLYFPIIRGEAKAKSAEHTIIPTGTERILLVEDEKAILNLTQKHLASLGYAVEARTSSLAALELFQAKPDKFDLVITDMTMPQMTGDLLAREVIKIRPDLPVILCTGFSETVTPEKAKNMGIKAFLLKPVLKEEIAHTIRKVMDETKGPTQE